MIFNKPQNRQGLRAISPREMSNSPQKLMNRGYFSPENMKIAPVDYHKITMFNTYWMFTKIACDVPEIAPVKKTDGARANFFSKK